MRHARDQITAVISTRKLVKLSKLCLLLFATLVTSSAYAPTPHTVHGTSFSNFPAQHADFLGSASYEALFDDPVATPDVGGAGPRPIIVGPNIRLNNPQSPFPAGLLGRSETTIAVGEDGNNLVAGWNDADGFLRVPFSIPPAQAGIPGLSGFAFSSDGGNTWTDGDAPTPFAASTPFFSGNAVTRGDPWMAVSNVNGADTFLYANLAVFDTLDTGNIVDAGVSVHRGNFTGSTFAWNDGRLLTSPNAPFDFYDKEAMVARGGVVLVSLTNFIGISAPGTNPAFCQFAGGFGQIEVWRSTDGGNTFQGPAIAGPDLTNTATDLNCSTGVLQQGSDPAIGKAGNVFVAWVKGPSFAGGNLVLPASEQIVGATSTDFGQTFSSPVVIRTIVPGRQNPPVGYSRPRYNDNPRLDIDRASGRIYAVFQDASVAGNDGIGGSGTVCLPASGAPSPGPPCPTGQRRVMLGGGADTDIYLSFSDDNGATWSTPHLVNSIAGDGRIQFWPVVTVGPHGEVNVVYYESREEQLNPDPTVIECSVRIVSASGSSPGLVRRSLRTSLVDTFMARSLDGGLTFQAPVKISTTTSNWCKAASNIRPNFGDYIGATTVGPRTFAVWADDRNTVLVGGVPRNVPDVFYTTIRTIAGDVNGDFKVDLLDAAAVALAYGSKPGDPAWNVAADLDFNGAITITDLALMAKYYGTHA